MFLSDSSDFDESDADEVSSSLVVEEADLEVGSENLVSQHVASRFVTAAGELDFPPHDALLIADIYFSIPRRRLIRINNNLTNIAPMSVVQIKFEHRLFISVM